MGLKILSPAKNKTNFFLPKGNKAYKVYLYCVLLRKISSSQNVRI